MKIRKIVADLIFNLGVLVLSAYLTALVYVIFIGSRTGQLQFTKIYSVGKHFIGGRG